MVSINKKLDEIENDSRILSASFHVGYLRHDNFAAGSGLIVVPSDMKYKDYAQEVLDDLYRFCVDRYSEFKYHGHALEVKEAMKESIECEYKHVVVTDSGDNTYLLNEYLSLENYNNKNLLFAGITDNKLFNSINRNDNQDYFDIELGTNTDELSRKIKLTVKIKNKGVLQQIFGDKDNYGDTLTLSVKGKPIDIVLIDKSVSFAEMHQFNAANIELNNYNIVVVKQGYIFPELKEYCNYSIMALTDGTTNQQTENIVFKQIMRPMLPFDKLNE